VSTLSSHNRQKLIDALGEAQRIGMLGAEQEKEGGTKGLSL